MDDTVFGTTATLKVRTYVDKEFNVLRSSVRCAEVGEIISPVFMYEPMYVWETNPYSPVDVFPFHECSVDAFSLLTKGLREYHTRNYVILLDDDILRKKFRRMFSDKRNKQWWLSEFDKRERMYREKLEQLRPDKFARDK